MCLACEMVCFYGTACGHELFWGVLNFTVPVYDRELNAFLCVVCMCGGCCLLYMLRTCIVPPNIIMMTKCSLCIRANINAYGHLKANLLIQKIIMRYMYANRHTYMHIPRCTSAKTPLQIIDLLQVDLDSIAFVICEPVVACVSVEHITRCARMSSFRKFEPQTVVCAGL
jgi:hypothetical protein